MLEEIVKYLTIYFFSMLKFIAGPTMGQAAGLSVIETIAITVLGMMSSVFLFTFFGEKLRSGIIAKYTQKQKKFSKRNRRFVTIWKKYGVIGVAFLTPIVFTPIGGTILVTSLGGSRGKIFFYMFLSALFWAIFFTVLIHFFVEKTGVNFSL